MTKSPATPEGEDMTSGEVIEWRDLQDAQMTALEDLWDNPEDECWNDLALPAEEANPPGRDKSTGESSTSDKSDPCLPGDAAVLTTHLAQTREAQAMVRQHVPAGVSPVDRVIGDRRSENARDGAA